MCEEGGARIFFGTGSGALTMALLLRQLFKKRNRARQDRTRQDRTGQDKTRQDKTGQDKTRQGWTGQDKTSQGWTGQDNTRQDRARQDWPKFKCQEESFPSLIQTGENSSLHLNLGYFRHFDHVCRGERGFSGWCSGALNKASPSHQALAPFFFCGAVCLASTSQAQAKPRTRAQPSQAQAKPRTRAQPSQAHG